MESFIEFNVSLHGRHFFATAPRSFSAWDSHKAKQFYQDLKRRYPEDEGFSITVTRWVSTGEGITEFCRGGSEL